MRTRAAAIVALTLLIAGPARAGWTRSSSSGLIDPADTIPLPLRSVWMASPTQVYAVGGGLDTGTSKKVGTVVQSNGAPNVTIVPRSQHGATSTLNAVWVSPTGIVQAFGDSKAHTAYAGSWSSTPLAAGTTNAVNIRGISFLSPTEAYLAGEEVTVGSYLRSWNGSTAGFIDPGGSMSVVFNAVAYWSTDNGYIAGPTDFYRQSAPGTLPMTALLGGGITGLSYYGGKVLAVGANPSPVAYVIDTASNVATPVTGFTQMGSATPSGAYLGPTGFAVVVGTNGTIVESQDGGLTWKAKASSSTAKLNAVHCSDENTCVAVGDGAEVLFYKNTAPSPGVTTNTGVLTFNEGDTVCPVGSARDFDQDAITLTWAELSPAIPGVTLAGSEKGVETIISNPTCFTVPTDICDPVGRDYTLSVSASDGRLAASASATVHVNDSVHLPPSIPVVTVDGAPASWQLGQKYTVHAASTVECGRPLTYTWSHSAGLPDAVVQSSDGSTVEFDLTKLAACPSEPASITVTVSDGAQTTERTEFPTITSVAPTFSGFSFSAFGDNATIPNGASVDVGVNASHPCGTMTYSWECQGTIDAPGDVAHYAFTNGGQYCPAQPFQCRVTITDQSSALFTVTPWFSLTYGEAAQNVAALSGTFSPALTNGDTLESGASATLTLSPPQCATYRWNCPAATVSVDGLSGTFVHPSSAVCAAQPVTCSVDVLDGATGLPARLPLAFDFKYGVTQLQTNLTATFDNGFTSPVTLSDRQSTTVTLTAQNACVTKFDYVWACSGITPDNSVSSWTFPEKTQVCTPESIPCTVTARDASGTQLSTKQVSFEVDYGVSHFAPNLTVDFPPGFTGLVGETQPVTATVTATHCPNDTFSYGWNCNIGRGISATSPDSPLVTFTHPDRSSPVCTTERAGCTVTVTPNSPGQPSNTVDVFVEYAPAFDPPTGVAIQPAELRTYQSAEQVDFTATPQGGQCSSSQTYLWQATVRSTGALVRKWFGGESFTFHVPNVCGTDATDVIDVKATSLVGSISGSFAVPVQASELNAPTISAPTPDVFAPQSGAELNCADPVSVIITPAYTASCDSPPSFAWTQQTNLPVDLNDLGHGKVEVKPRPGSFGSVIGHTGRFQLVIKDSGLSSDPQVFEYTFLPNPFVKLDHQADRPTAAPGEAVNLRVGIGNDCKSAVDGIDLHLSLNQLQYVSGSARFKGAAIADPEISGGELVFRNLPLPAEGESQPVLSYTARRMALSSGPATSVAVAKLTAAPDVVVSESAGARTLGGGPNSDAVSCECQSAGAPLFAWLALGALSLVRRRRR